MSENQPPEAEAAEVESPPEPDAPHEEENPRGTMLLMMLFLILIVGMWGYVYLIMLGRG